MPSTISRAEEWGAGAEALSAGPNSRIRPCLNLGCCCAIKCPPTQPADTDLWTQPVAAALARVLGQAGMPKDRGTRNRQARALTNDEAAAVFRCGCPYLANALSKMKPPLVRLLLAASGATFLPALIMAGH